MRSRAAGADTDGMSSDTRIHRIEAWFFDALAHCGADLMELKGHATFEALGVGTSELTALLRRLQRDLGIALGAAEIGRALTVGEAIERAAARAA
jgi:hypothetical protein